jgi:hypothetical protein
LQRDRLDVGSLGSIHAREVVEPCGDHGVLFAEHRFVDRECAPLHRRCFFEGSSSEVHVRKAVQGRRERRVLGVQCSLADRDGALEQGLRSIVRRQNAFDMGQADQGPCLAELGRIGQGRRKYFGMA